jgi:uncharacterized glyoxalase superfamily protein PhnB
MQITSFYPVIMTADVPATAAFYREHFGFTPAFEIDWYVHLTQPADPSVNLAILRFDHETVPAHAHARTQGLILNFEVADVDAHYTRLTAAGLPIHMPLRDEAFGQRHFITADPNGVLIDVITPIEPDEIFAAHYTSTSDAQA